MVIIKFKNSLIYLFVTAIGVELLLQVISLFFLEIKPNSELYSYENQIWIMGESTSVWGGEKSYPAILQSLINQEFPEKKIKVVNLALAGSDSQKQLDILKKNLNGIYRPKMLVAMLGINDWWALSNNSFQETHNVFWNLRIYRFGFLFYKNYLERYFQRQSILIEFPKVHALRADLDLKITSEISDLISKKQDQKLEKYFNTKVPIDELSDYYYFSSEQVLKEFGNVNDEFSISWQIRLLKKCITHNENHGPCIENLLYCQTIRNVPYKEQITLIDKILKIGPIFPNTYISISTEYMRNGRPHDAIVLVENYLREKPINNYFLWKHFIEILQSSKDEARLQYWGKIYKDEFKDIADPNNTNILQEKRENYENHNVFRQNFKEIENLSKIYKFRLVSVQYPFLSNVQLKKLLSNSSSVIWVENKNNFQSAIKNYKFEELFTDRFSKSFGHFTPIGAQIVAENIFNSIKDDLKKY